MYSYGDYVARAQILHGTYVNLELESVERYQNKEENKVKTPIVVMVAALAVTVSGCASIVRGSSQSVALTTVPENGATCTVQSEDGGAMQVVTPGTITLEKSGQDLPIRCSKAGYQDTVAVLPSNFDAWTIGNLLIPGGILWIGVDAATGAMNKYPKTLQVQLLPQTQADATPPKTATTGKPIN